MLRKVFGPTTCCLILSWGVLAAPRKADPTPAYYHPSTVGDKLVFEEDYGDHSRQWVVEVTDARQKGAALIVTVRAGEGDGTSESWQYEVSDKGVYKVGEGDAVLESPECYLHLPFKKGETWETGHKHEGKTYTTKYTVSGEEEVEVPAGKFRCIRIESEFVYNGMTYTHTRWRAPRCGVVKDLVVGKDNDNLRTDDVRTTVLKSFTPGGK
jgi:hypothetical protein